MSEQPIGPATQPGASMPPTAPPPSRGGGTGKGLLLGLGGGCGCLTLGAILLLLLLFLLSFAARGQGANPTPVTRSTPVATVAAGGQPGGQPSSQPASQPSSQPSSQPASQPAGQPSGQSGSGTSGQGGGASQAQTPCDFSPPQGDADLQVCLVLGRIQGDRVVDVYRNNTVPSAETPNAAFVIFVQQARTTVPVVVGLFRDNGSKNKPDLIGRPESGQIRPDDRNSIIVIPFGGQLPAGRYAWALCREQPDGTVKLIAALPFTVQ